MAKAPPNELVSVIIPVYNGERFMPDAVANVHEQAYQPLEIIIVDDASTDSTPQLLAALADQVTIVRLGSNQGPAAARNAGLARARGSIVAFLDVDDLWPPDRLGAMVACFRQHPACGVVRGYVRISQPQDRANAALRYSSAILGPWIGSAIYRKEIFDLIGAFDPGLRYGEDLDWFFRAREQGVGVHLLNRTTLYVRRHDQNMTRGLNCHELNVLRVLRRSLDRRRHQETGVAGASAQRPIHPEGI